MARPRRFLQKERDGRYFVQIGRGPKSRVHLGTKDKTEAERIGEFIVFPWYQSRLSEVRLRVKLHRANPNARSVIDQQITDFGRGEYSDEILDDPEITKHVKRLKDALNDYDEAYDLDRVPQESAAKGINHLVDLGRDDLLSELLTLTVTDKDVEPDVLRELQRAIDKRLGTRSKIPATAERLSDCKPVWRKRLEARNIGEPHIVAYESVFDEFVEHCDDSYLSRLAKSHFVEWQNHVDEGKGDRGEQWRKSQLIPIGAILRKARKFTEWKFPLELDQWLQVFEYGKAKPDKKTRYPLTVESYNILLAKLEEWASIDVQEYADALPFRQPEQRSERGRAGMAILAKGNNVKQAKRVQRYGVQWSAILRLAINCGCDNSDISLITYDSLDLDATLPMFNLTRRKNEVDRHTPLLPSTVAAIKRWREFETPKIERVFTNDAKREFVSSKVSHNFKRLRDEAGLDGVWFKHCRNVGATLGRNHRLTISECEAFLGHEVNGMCVFYMGDTPDDYLVPLVNLIGAEYFDGEQAGSDTANMMRGK